MLKIGSHVGYKEKGLLGCVEEALSYGANTFMFYTGAPQNTIRKPIDEKLTREACTLMKENNINIEDVVCHAPYIVNLANNKDMSKYEFSIEFLIKEVERCSLLGIKYLVLHPGNAVGIDRTIALKNITYALNLILNTNNTTIICLETMAGKGTELGVNLHELKDIMEGIIKKDQIGICLDTCHLNDSGVDLKEFNSYLDELDREIGLNYVKVMHVNDSKNPLASHKDRHENIGLGSIGFDTLMNVVYNERLEGIPKILETPYVESQNKKTSYPPYKFEIDMIRNQKFNENLKTEILDYYDK